MSRLHLVVGILGLVAFLASGQYMDLGYDHLRGLNETTRLLFRSTHIYLLLTALVNLALGLYLVAEGPGWRRWLQWIGSAFLVASPVLCGMAFLTEPWLTELARPYTRPAIYGCLAGMGLHLVSRMTCRKALGDRENRTRQGSSDKVIQSQ